MSRVINFLLALDQAANAFFGGRPRETISGTIGRALMQPKPPAWAKAAQVVVDLVFGKGHCVEQATIELARRAKGD